jgi:hypothetical protein
MSNYKFKIIPSTAIVVAAGNTLNLGLEKTMFNKLIV